VCLWGLLVTLVFVGLRNAAFSTASRDRGGGGDCAWLLSLAFLVCCSVQLCVAVWCECCSELPFDAVCCSAVHALCCSVLQYVTVCDVS